MDEDGEALDQLRELVLETYALGPKREFLFGLGRAGCGGNSVPLLAGLEKSDSLVAGECQ